MSRGTAFFRNLILPIYTFFGRFFNRKAIQPFEITTSEPKLLTKTPKKVSNKSAGSMFKKQKPLRIGNATRNNYRRRSYKGLYYINKSQRKWIKKYVDRSTGDISGALRADIYYVQLLAGRN